MRLALLLAATALWGCDHPAKQPPIDLAALPGPAPGDFGSEADLPARMAATIGPRYAAGEEGRLEGVGGVELRYHVQRATPERGAIVLLPGRTEAVQKYAEVIAELVDQGFTVYGLDHRGQGASARMLADHDKGYVEFFADYVDDLEAFRRTVVAPAGHARVFVLATSMGGAIAAVHASRRPGAFDALALVSPMLEIDTGGFPTAVAATIAETGCSVGSGEGYVPGAGPYREEASVAESDVTHSEARWALKQALYREHPELRLGGATYRWLCEALAASSWAQGAGEDNPQPTLILQAGADDVVRPGGQRAYCDDAPRCQLERLEGGFHELLAERDDVRGQAMSDVVRWFAHFAEAP